MRHVSIKHRRSSTNKTHTALHDFIDRRHRFVGPVTTTDSKMEHVQVLTTVISGLPQHCKRLKGRCGDASSRLIRVSSRSTSQKPYSVSQKKSPYGFLKFSPKRLGIFNQFFTHLLYDDFYTRLQIFI